jgi:hypothetical protein
MSLLMNSEGGIRVVCGGGWELEPLRVHYGARAAYRVSRNSQGVRVEGRSVEGSCVLETPQTISLQPLPKDYPQYYLVR